MMSVPEHYRYTAEHEWVAVEGNVATVGITNHAQQELTDIVYVELPEIGREYTTGEAVAVVESVKAASDIYAPLDGEIVEVNEALEAEPALVNSDPHSGGWIFKIEMSDGAQLETLMNATAYSTHTGG